MTESGGYSVERLAADRAARETRLPPSYAEAFASLTAPGAPFELATDGRGIRAFARRPPDLAWLLDEAANFGDRQAVLYGDAPVWSYRAFVNRVRRCAGGLRKLAAPGARVAILGANHPDWMTAFWASIYAGLVPVAMNGWWTAAEIGAALNTVGANIVVGDAKRLERAGPVLGDEGKRFQIFAWDAGDKGTASSSEPFDALMAAPAGRPDVSESDLAMIVFTSGTTGRPRGAMLSHGAVIAGLMNASFAATVAAMTDARLGGVNADVTLLASLPFFHVGGCHGAVLGGIAGGQRIVIAEGPFDPHEVLRLIERHRVTRWSAVPTMVQRVCDAAETAACDLSSVTTLGYGAAPSGPDLAALARKTFSGLRAASNAYGLTETGSVIAMNTGRDFIERPHSVGRPFPTVEVRIADETGAVLEQGEIGEIHVRGPFLMSGYWDAARQTAEMLGEDGWLRTGDIGRLDEDGFLYILDRKKDIIIRGGENVYAPEVEQRLEAHPSVAEAAVVGTPHGDLGEQVCALVRLREGETADPDGLRAWVSETLAAFKTPDRIRFSADALPRNAAGKLLKSAIRPQFRALSG